MTNVIQFPLQTRTLTPPSFSLSAADEFLDACMNRLCEDDYLDLLDAINDRAFYDQCDEDIQLLVNIYTDLI